PYKNPFGLGTLCQAAPQAMPHFSTGVTGSCPAGSNSSPAQGCPDGYAALPTTVPWNNAITVWRNNSYTPVFDSQYQYTLAPLAAPAMAVDSGTAPVQLYPMSANLVSSVFAFTQSGANW